MTGCSNPSSQTRSSGSEKTLCRNQGRLSEPSGRSASSPKCPAMASNAGVPGSTTSRAISSASTQCTPRSPNSRTTVDFPEPMPPVNPTIFKPATNNTFSMPGRIQRGQLRHAKTDTKGSDPSGSDPSGSDPTQINRQSPSGFRGIKLQETQTKTFESHHQTTNKPPRPRQDR